MLCPFGYKGNVSCSDLFPERDPRTSPSKRLKALLDIPNLNDMNGPIGPVAMAALYLAGPLDWNQSGDDT